MALNIPDFVSGEIKDYEANAVAELTLSTSGSSATATVEDIQSYNV